jgi:hypothetical protein
MSARTSQEGSICCYVCIPNHLKPDFLVPFLFQYWLTNLVQGVSLSIQFTGFLNIALVVYDFQKQTFFIDVFQIFLFIRLLYSYILRVTFIIKFRF